MRIIRTMATGAAAVVLAGCSAVANYPIQATVPQMSCHSRAPLLTTYLGVFVPGFPQSVAALTQFEDKTGIRPSLISYYPRFGDSFAAASACAAVQLGATPLVQIDPVHISLARIAAGQYDAYLRSYAAAVKAFGARVVLSFGHEMNGNWYSWGYQHTSPAVFVAAWRHIVTVFRAVGAYNVTWLWTVNIIEPGRIPVPAPWWPGASYVTWVGIDGYYHNSSTMFASLFGPTIVAARALTSEPILITETAAPSTAGQPAKIADLFASIRTYGLLGFVWFDANGGRDWRLRSPAAIAAFRHETEAYHKLTS